MESRPQRKEKYAFFATGRIWHLYMRILRTVDSQFLRSIYSECQLPNRQGKKRAPESFCFFLWHFFGCSWRQQKSMDTYRHFQKYGRALFHDRASRQTHTSSRKKSFFVEKDASLFAITPRFKQARYEKGNFSAHRFVQKKRISLLLGSSRRNTKESSSSWERYRTLEIGTIRPLSRFNSINPFHAHVGHNLWIREKKEKKE